MTRKIIIFLNLVFLCASVLTSQAKNPTASHIRVNNDLVDVSAEDADLADILNEISRQSNAPFGIMHSGSKKTTAHFSNVPIKEALKMLIRNNYAYLEDGSGKIVLIYFLAENTRPEIIKNTASDNPQKSPDEEQKSLKKKSNEEPPIPPIPKEYLPLVKINDAT